MMVKYILWYSILSVICGGLTWILLLTIQLKRRQRHALTQNATPHQRSFDAVDRMADIFAQNMQASSAFRHAVEQYLREYKRILVLDDEEITLYLFRKKFHVTNTVALFYAHSGEEAIARPDVTQMDLFIVDLILSGGDLQGDDVIAWLAAQQVTAPILVMSSWTDADMRRKLAAYPNVVAFLTKPIEFPTLFALIEQTLHIRLRK
jgi:CheY-like chemotaxis protein